MASISHPRCHLHGLVLGYATGGTGLGGIEKEHHNSLPRGNPRNATAAPKYRDQYQAAVLIGCCRSRTSVSKSSLHYHSLPQPQAMRIRHGDGLGGVCAWFALGVSEASQVYRLHCRRQRGCWCGLEQLNGEPEWREPGAASFYQMGCLGLRTLSGGSRG
jgi:hypothetical protein